MITTALILLHSDRVGVRWLIRLGDSVLSSITSPTGANLENRQWGGVEGNFLNPRAVSVFWGSGACWVVWV